MLSITQLAQHNNLTFDKLIEGRLRYIANPHCEQRTELILKQLEEDTFNPSDDKEEDEEDEV